MGFKEQISKTFAAEQFAGLVKKTPDNMLANMTVDELYFYVNEMLIDGDLVAVLSPKLESRETRNRLFFTISMPRVVPESLKIDLNGRVLQIFAEKSPTTIIEGDAKAYGVYINLPQPVVPESIKFGLDSSTLSLMFKKR